MRKTTSMVLAIYPNARGFGYAFLERPKTLIDSGIVTIRPMSNGKVLDRIKTFTEFYTPTLLIIKEKNNNINQTMRVTELLESIAKYASEINLPIYKYSRQQVQDVFEQFGAETKIEIAQQIMSWIPELITRAPKIRKPWMDEDYNMGVFDAVSLAIAHEYLTE